MNKIQDYQNYVKKGASEKYNDVKFAALALVGEVGEVCDVIKKHNIYTELNFDYRQVLIDELGDVLWQYMALLNSQNISIDFVIDHNIRKLNERHGGAKLDKTGGKRKC